jgi:hypothetical protein
MAETHFLPPPLMLSSADQELLAVLDARLGIVRDRTRSVADGLTTGFFLYGEGGVGKSYTVLSELDDLGADFKLWNGRMTGRGLFDVLHKYPNSVHVLEDIERIYRDSIAQGILRAALWGQEQDGRMVRRVTYEAHNFHAAFYFEGGIIITGNRPLHDLPELRAIATRINPMRLDVSNEEAAALMRSIALKGHRHGDTVLDPAACLEVVEYIIGEIASATRNLDLRLLHTAFRDRLMWDRGKAETHWKILVKSSLEERVVSVPKQSRAARLARERDIARSIKMLPAAERLRRWRDMTGKGQSALYERLAEAA